MSKIKNNPLVILVILLITNSASAQDFKKTLLDLRAEYETLNSIHVSMLIRVFENAKSSKPFYEEKAEIKRNGDNYFYKMGGHDMLLNQQYLVVIDNESKEIVLSKRDLAGERDFKKEMVFSMDSVFAFYKEAVYLGNEDGKFHYRAKQPKGPIKEVDLFINGKTNVISKLTYSYHEGQFVSIDFQTFDKHPQFDEKTFDEKQFITTDNNTIKPSSGFLNYAVIKASK